MIKFPNKAIEKNKGTKNTILIVGHSKTNRVIVGSLMGMEPNNFYGIPRENACINIIDIENGKRHFKRINYCGHLR